MNLRPDQVEKFSAAELTNLRTDLLRAGIDSRQAAEILTSFLMGRGYGVDSQRVMDAALHIERMTCNADCMQAELERVAMVM
ncbi:MAG: hypothetical protein ACP5M4_00855 [Acidobacteriaceae bacterium]